MRNDPYRHSVWIDVFGIVLFGAVLVGGTGYLLYHAGGAAGGLGGGGAIASGRERPVPLQPGSRMAARRPAPSPEPTPLFDEGGVAGPRGSGVEAPFSKSWQEQATPDLTGPAGASSPPSGGGAPVGGAAPEPSGPTIASKGLSGRGGSGTARRESAGAGWRAEARRFSGRARALSNQLGQMARSSEESGEETSRKEASGQASAAGASSDDRNVGDPPSVPIDDHVHWLAVLGILWGMWRIWRGG